MKDDDKLWIDQLRHKHECFTYDRYSRQVEIEHDGQRYSVLMPDYEAPIHIRHVAQSGELLFLLGRHEQTFADEHSGWMAVARRRDDGVFVVHIWHELYPWALQYLGLEPKIGPT